MTDKFMFDTNIFNRILDQQIDIALITLKREFFVTHVQDDEINNTTDMTRRKQLQATFKKVNSNETATKSFIIKTSKLGKAEVGNAKLYKKLLTLLDLDKPKQHENNIKDALIGETAIKNNYTLVTEDRSLHNNVGKLGGNTITFTEFKNK